MRVGLTGGIASGKSTVSAMFKAAGAFVIDADGMAHALLKKGEAAYTAVLALFGPAILDATGEIDRKALGAIVFHADEKRKALNQIVHPFVFQAAEQERERILQIHPRAVIIFDVPLLIETGVYTTMDILIVVYVDEATQIERLIQREACSRADAEKRIRTQRALAEKVRLAHEVIDNREDRFVVQKIVLDIYHCLCRTVEG